MLNNQQITAIDNEITRLQNIQANGDLATYIAGRVDSLKWAKENL